MQKVRGGKVYPSPVLDRRFAGGQSLCALKQHLPGPSQRMKEGNHGSVPTNQPLISGNNALFGLIQGLNSGNRGLVPAI